MATIGAESKCPQNPYLAEIGPDTRSRHADHPALEDQRQRNLINQRNFRSRRKQYVVELEQKIRAYEQAGVGATKQVQAAAQAVAAENTVLRTLVRAQLGWSEQELGRYITQRICHNRTPTFNETHGTRDCCHCQKRPRRLGVGCEQQLVAFTKSPPPVQNAPNRKRVCKNRPNESTSQFVPLSYNSDIEAQDLTVVPRSWAAVAHKGNSLSQSTAPQETIMAGLQTDTMGLGQNRAHEDPNEVISPDSSMSCEQAAAVLSELRSQGSVELIREELGCASSGTCKVTHWELFQKLDDSL